MIKHVIIIAEAGVNHNGDIELAKELVKQAALAGADYVKFQTFKADKLVSKSAQKAEYQLQNSANGESTSQFEMLKALELSVEDHYILIDECKKYNIKFLSTAFDLEGLEFLNTLGIDFFKSPSGELTNLPYLIKMAKMGKPIVISTGMANLDEINAAIGVFEKYGISKSLITVLHCNTEYPTPMNHVNLKAMNQIRDIFNVSIGYSDHTLGIEVPIAAVALGASIIEKHFTLNRSLPGPDHKASLEPSELRLMVQSIRNIELAISGSGIKEKSPSEEKNITIARKSLHIKYDLPRGHIISENDLISLRPGNGISPMDIERVIGKELLIGKIANEILNLEDIK